MTVSPATPPSARLLSARTALFAALLGLAAAASADAAGQPQPAHAACVEHSDAARCDDPDSRQRQSPAAGPDTREIARRAAVRGNRDEQRALRELLVKHTGLCSQKPEQYCPPHNLAACTEQLRQTCTTIKRQAAMCEAQTATYCARQRGSAQCVAALSRQCDNEKLTLDQVLAKYPNLSPNQKAQLKQIATQLENNRDQSLFGALASRFLKLLGFAG